MQAHSGIRHYWTVLLRGEEPFVADRSQLGMDVDREA